MNENRISQMLTAITFFKVTIKTLEGHFKLSQNKTALVRNKIAKELIGKGKGKFANNI